MDTRSSQNALFLLFGVVAVGVLILGVSIQFGSTSGSSSSGSASWAYTTDGKMPAGMTSGAWDVANAALDIAQHLTGPMLDNFDDVAKVALGISSQTNAAPASTSSQGMNANNATSVAIPANSNRTSAQPLVATSGNATTGDQQILKSAKAYWNKQCSSSGGVCPIPFQCAMFVETAYGAAGHPLPQTYNAIDYWQGYQNRPGWQEIPVKTGPPMVGDMIVWGGGEITMGYPNGIGHIAIVVAVQLPDSKTNGSVTVADANTPTWGTGKFTTPDKQLAPSITKPGIHLYQMPLLLDATGYSVQTWGAVPGAKPYYIVGYIRQPSLIKDFQSVNPGSAGASNYVVTGSPTITPDRINQILQANSSPVAGQGQNIYDLGVQYHIDPIYALAFFQKESSFGTQGVARVTLSLGNERCIQTLSCVDAQGNVLCTPAPGKSCANFNGYAKFPSWKDGFEQWYKLIDSAYVGKGLKTVDQIIPVYAPASDGNDVPGYIKTVEQLVDQWRSGK